MSSGTQIDLDWTGVDAGQGGAAAPPASAPNGAGGGTNAYLTDEEILGMAPVGQTLLSVRLRRKSDGGSRRNQRILRMRRLRAAS